MAQELIAHGCKLFYYDNRNKGEVDFLIDDYESLSTVPIKVKSGKDYTVHSALNTFVRNEGYQVKKAIVLSNEREIKTEPFPPKTERAQKLHIENLALKL